MMKTQLQATGAGPTPLSLQIASWALALSYQNAPIAVRRALSTCLLYNVTMGVSVDAVSDDIGNRLSTIASEAGRARVLTGESPRSARDAAFINAGLITARGQNDTYPETVTHIGCLVVPTVMALADEYGCEIEDVLSALLVGYEVIPRIAHNIADLSSARGFRATSIYGVIGAAVAGARLLRLSVEETAHAISIATQLSSGVMQTWIDGSNEWRLQVANASRHAVEAVLLARSGIEGSRHCLEGESGFVRAYSGGELEFETAGWRIVDMVFKPYPGCAFNQGAVHSLRQCMVQHKIATSDVCKVVVTMNPVDAAYPAVNSYGPFLSSAGAIMSLPFMLAATLRDGQPKLGHFNCEYGNGDLHGLSRLVSLQASGKIRRWNCIVNVILVDGAEHSVELSEARPFSFEWSEVLEVLRGVVEEWPTSDKDHKFNILAEKALNIHELADFDQFASFLFGLNCTGAPVLGDA